MFRRVALAALAALTLIHAQAPPKPDFNGSWQMNPAKSDFGGGPVSERRLDKIALEGINFKDTMTQKLQRGAEATYDMIYTIDGKECTNHVRGNLVKSTARWEGDVLVIDSTVFTLLKAHIEDRWSISPDGKVITVKRHLTGARNADQLVILERQ